MTVELSKDAVNELSSIVQSEASAFLLGLILGGVVLFFLTRFYYKKVVYPRLLNQLDDARKNLQAAEKARDEYKVLYQQLQESTKGAYDYIYARNALDETSHPYSNV